MPIMISFEELPSAAIGIYLNSLFIGRYLADNQIANPFPLKFSCIYVSFSNDLILIITELYF